MIDGRAAGGQMHGHFAALIADHDIVEQASQRRRVAGLAPIALIEILAPETAHRAQVPR